jgi:mannosyl-3-phosphoglycerate synthase
VSNSNDKNFEAEPRLLTSISNNTQRESIAVHQQDKVVAQAFKEYGMPKLVNSAGRIHYGEGEAMVIGNVLAKLADKIYVGFIDANFVPGACS